MLKFLKWTKWGFWATVVLVLATALASLSVLKHHTRPTWEEISVENITAQGVPQHQRAIRKSRQSAVLVKSASLNFWGGTSTTTGTYFIANNKHYVITVDHGIQGPCWLITIADDYNYTGCKKIVAVNKERDYVIMEVNELLPARVPIHIPRDLPHGGEWKTSYSILTNIVYTGYPNTLGPLTLRGDVVGYGDNQSLYVFSHAYGGASGSGVFTEEGKYIGYIVAIDVGATELGVDVLENIVIVAPTFNVDWSAVLN